MYKSERKCFEKLKLAITSQLKSNYSHVPDHINEWKKKEIEIFQNDLLKKVNGRVSEKWFYTHMKSNGDTLPRIDILDLLSQYVGYANWNEFQSKHSTVQQSRKKLAYLLLIPLPLLIGLLYFNSTTKTYSFCLVDPYSKKPIRKNIVVTYLNNTESPIKARNNELGCFELETNEEFIAFSVSSPYYMPDTIRRKLGKQDTYEEIILKSNDYALILHLFTNEKLADWSNRKAFLNDMFQDNAKIYQIIEEGQQAMAIYNKEEFIRRLMFPTGSLKRLEILETVYHQDKIAILKFKQGEL